MGRGFRRATMPIKVIEQDGRFHLILETKWRGQPMTLGVAKAPSFATRKEAVAAKKNVSILSSAGVTAALYSEPSL